MRDHTIILCRLTTGGLLLLLLGGLAGRAAWAQEMRAASLGAPAPSAKPTSQRAPEPRRPQLVAATDDAIQTLKREILGAALTPDLTIRQFLYRTGGTDQLLGRIEKASPRGGTRWRNDQTCEVMMEVPGSDVADTLGAIAKAHPGELGIPSESLSRGLAVLRERTFSAVGVSTGSSNLAALRPDDPDGPWRAVSDATRVDALRTAKLNAIAHVMESLRPIDVGGGKTIDNLLSFDDADASLRQWVGTRPITGVEFGDDLQVRLTLSAPPDELWEKLKPALVAHHLGPAEQDAAAWAQLRSRVIEETSPATGRSAAEADKSASPAAATVPSPASVPVAPPQPAPPPAPPLITIPRQPPEWVYRQLDSDGVAQGQGLKTARAAEADALAKLRAQVERLPLAGGTVGELARRDPQIERAITRAIRRAPTTKVDYQNRGKVKVRVTFILEQLWREINEPP